jgi:hypothetical protein
MIRIDNAAGVRDRKRARGTRFDARLGLDGGLSECHDAGGERMTGGVQMRRRLIVLAVSALLVVFSGTPAFAMTEHDVGCDSVSGRNVFYEDNTEHYAASIAQGVGVWNDLGGVTISPDTPLHINDLEFKEVFRDDIPFTGIYDCTWAEDYAYLNYWIGSRVTPEKFMRTAAHELDELGHALRIGDHTSAAYESTLMWKQSNSILVPMAHDILDYETYWAPEPPDVIDLPDMPTMMW